MFINHLQTSPSMLRDSWKHWMRVLFVVGLLVSLSGCTSNGTEPVANSNIQLVDEVAKNRTTAVHFLIQEDFVASPVPGESTIEIPSNTLFLAVSARLNRGIHQNFFIEGISDDCDDLTTSNGLMVSLGVNNGSGYSICAAPPESIRTFSWATEAGTVEGTLTIVAIVEAPQ